MSNFGIIALTPSTWPESLSNPTIAVAAARAGAIGVLGAEFVRDDLALATSIEKVIRLGRGRCGIKCSVTQLTTLTVTLARLAAHGIDRSNLVILTTGQFAHTQAQLEEAIELAHRHGLAAFVEATSLQEALSAQAAQADAIIAKGHEASGCVAEETTFVFLQHLSQQLTIPIWAEGGIGLNTASACYVAGCAGIVLEGQLLLTKESPLPIDIQAKIAKLDGSETTAIGSAAGQSYRVYARAGLPAVDSLNNKLQGLLNDTLEPNDSLKAAWRTLVCKEVHESLERSSIWDRLWFLSQDVAFAASLAARFLNTAGILKAIWQSVCDNIRVANTLAPLREGSPLAVSHKTQFPIVQGAMTRVSDSADFAVSVSRDGALPFVALALMRKQDAEQLLADCHNQLAGSSWGVGLLGFVPKELREEQLAAIERYKPPFALIAGGRPDQAQTLESMGIVTYLHVPSPSLLSSFIELGSHNFIFEGKECGGHVGPRSSFVLWESAIEVLLSSIGAKDDASTFQVLFAGGIHDHISAAMVAALAAPLAERGVRVGILMGTAYLFTEEAVVSGAIVKTFQEAALRCEQTVLLETGPGHAIRCLDSPYRQTFNDIRRQLEQQGRSRNEIRESLELLNLGRLRTASKGVTRSPDTGAACVRISDEIQWSEGMYMMGQVAALRSQTTTIAQLHHSVSNDSLNFLNAVASQNSITVSPAQPHQGEGIAIIGMSCVFPKAHDLSSFWDNILNKVDAITEVPKEQWDWERLYEPNPQARDKTYSKWGGFLPEIPFDPTRYGIPPSSLSSIDPMQLILLEVARAALEDAGYLERSFPKERTSVILANAGHGPITAFYSLRSMLDWKLSDMDEHYRKILEERLPEWSEDTLPGYLGNVTAGRVANRLDLGGINFSIDAACASSLAALHVAVQNLRCQASDVVLLAATDTHNQPGDYLSFSKVHALSPTGHCRTFDASADGIVLSEGIAMLVLKRLSDAERDGDRVYAVLRGIGGSSDGRDLSLTAPSPSGQILALSRAYEDAGISPATIGLIEAHGTGTVAGDKAEIEALCQVFNKANAARQICAIGSVKTMIGHTKCAAGLASVIKTALALYHRILPPTSGVDNPNPTCNFHQSPFYINTQARPWLSYPAGQTPALMPGFVEEFGGGLHPGQTDLTDPALKGGVSVELAEVLPRRAGVSAFGFGGTNFHAVLEEHPEKGLSCKQPVKQSSQSELFLIRGTSRQAIVKAATALEELIQKAIAQQSNNPPGPVVKEQRPTLASCASSWHLSNLNQPHSDSSVASLCLSIVALTLDDLLFKLQKALELLSDTNRLEIKDPRGIYFVEHPLAMNHKIAFLFPGQGSQHVNMLRDLSLVFADVTQVFEKADTVLHGCFPELLSRYIFPPPAFTSEEQALQQNVLTETHIAQPAMAAADLAMLKVLRSLAIAPDMVAGHSFGEYVALCCAGALSEDDLLHLSEARGHLMSRSSEQAQGSMAAVTASVAQIEELLQSLADVTLANINAPNQCVLAGERNAVEAAIHALGKKNVHSKLIPVSQAFHSPHMASTKTELEKILQGITFATPCIPVFSNTTANPYSTDTSAIASMLAEHVIQPVQFLQEIEQMYRSGAGIFVEVGPGSVLTHLVSTILGDRPHLAVSCDRVGRPGVSQLQHTLAELACHGVPVNLTNILKYNFPDWLKSTNPSGETNKKGANHRSFKYLINSTTIRQPQAKESGTNRQPEFHPSQSTTTKYTAPDSGSHKAHQSQDQNEHAPAPNDKPTRQPSNEVMLEFQRTMLQMTNSFLETQQQVMLAYLGSVRESGEAANGLTELSKSFKTISLASLAPSVPAQEQVTATIPTSPAENNDSPKPDEAQELTAIVTQQADTQESNPTTTKTEDLIAGLIEIVSERTGYPPEMLDPMLDLEADLGIDSIKRVEILNSFRKLLPEQKQKQLESGIEKLAGTKTLKGITDWITHELGSEPIVLSSSDPTQMQPSSVQQSKSRITRGRINIIELPPAMVSSNKQLMKVLITDDGNGVAVTLAAKLNASGQTAIIIRHSQASSSKDLSSLSSGEAAHESSPIYLANLADKASVSHLIEKIKEEHGSIGAIWH
ncbi:MAG: acyltransferase domain-containing protein, partial [Candidatus Melainabacteria bacterium]|nr:acyltransferase domain-containing protein [Candidatus Melainabacteria bacterium]